MSRRNLHYLMAGLLAAHGGLSVSALAADQTESPVGHKTPKLELQTSDRIGGNLVEKRLPSQAKPSSADLVPVLEVSGGLDTSELKLVEPVVPVQAGTQAERSAPVEPVAETAVSDKARAKAEARAAREAKRLADAQAKAEAKAAREAKRQADAQAKAEAKAAADAQVAVVAEEKVQAQVDARAEAAESNNKDEAPTREKVELEAKKARGSANFKAKVAAELQGIADEKERSAHRAQERAEAQADVAAKARSEARSAARDAAEAKVKAADAAKLVADLESKAATEALNNVGSGTGASSQTEAEIVAAREEARKADALAQQRAATAARAKNEADAQADAASVAQAKAESQAKVTAKAAEEAQLAAHDAAVAKARAAATAQAVADFEAKSAADAIAKAQARAQAAADAKAKADAEVLVAKSGTKSRVDPSVAVKSAVAARLALPIITEPYTALKSKETLRLPGWDVSIIGVSRPGKVLTSQGAGDQAASVGEWVVVFLELKNASDVPQSVLDYNFQFQSGGATAGCQNPEAGGCRYFISGLSEARGLYQESRGLTILHANYDKKEFAPGAMARTALVFDLPLTGQSLKFGIADSYVDLGNLKNVPVTPPTAR